jgi:pilus assembly protein TadC
MPEKARPPLRVIDGALPRRPESVASEDRARRPSPPVDTSAFERAVLAFAAALAAGILALSLAVLGRTPPAVGLGAVLLAVLIGAIAPGVVFRARARARRRRLRRALPLALDLLAIFIAAGLSLESALRRLAELRNDAFSEELRRVLADRGTDSGVSALREFASRTRLVEVAELAERLAGSDPLGARTADVVRDQLARLRARSTARR